ncbi:hypothetical protein Barb6_02668 [Bacteroidales bacterium Barb6]|nr:hypothetical protein Barb6_02668 [Bacteroidales bacterium Barb6]
MRTLFICAALIAGCLQSLRSQQQELKFNADGKFKIVQFTDLHYIYGDARSDLEQIGEVIDAEKPDLIIVTGDVIYGKPAEESMRAVVEQIAAKKTPFVILFGNHDDENGLSRAELFDIVKSYPCNLTTSAEGISGFGNGILPLKGANGRNAAVLYCLDSHAYSTIKNVEGYDYIKFDQIQWYRENSAAFTKQNNGAPLPSLAFFHIPLPEYAQAASDEKAVLIGTRKEKSCPPQLNSGLFAAMKEMGDIMGTFVGHDHDNDYAVLYKDILLAYGRYTGGNTVYNNLKPNGARVIELTEGERSIKTWIHLKGNQIIHTVNYPALSDTAEYTLQPGDLIFQEACSGQTEEAIKGVTESIGGYNFTHVGMVYKDERDSIQVIEAIPPRVKLTPLTDYLYPSGREAEACHPKSVVARLKPAYRHCIPQAVKEALLLLGQKYDYGYTLNNDKYYCSELIYDVLLKANGGTAVFPLNRMTFKADEAGEVLPEWTDYFRRLGIPVPEGEEGINPGAMSRSEVIEVVPVNLYR